MKHYYMLAAAAIFTAVTLNSCSDFLTEESQVALTEEQVFANPTLTEINLQAIYSTWKECFKDERAWHLMIGTDEGQSGAQQYFHDGVTGQAAMDGFTGNLNSENDKVRDAWNYRWPAVTAAAKIIRVGKSNPEAQTVGTAAAKLFGEASFIRGSIYYQLAMLWGRLPIVDMDRVETEGYGRKSLTETWEFLISDLENAAKYAPETNTAGRATRYAALLMLAKAYMSAPAETNLRDYNKAQEALLQIKNSNKFTVNGVEFASLFDYNTPNTAESIFEWQCDNLAANKNQIQFQIGSRVAASTYGDRCHFAGYDHAVPTQYAYTYRKDGGLWEEGDVRYASSLRDDFRWTKEGDTEPTIPDYECISWENLGDDYDELLPHIKKYEDFRTDFWSGNGINNMWWSGKNIPWLRYADALLLLGECYIHTGNPAEGLQYINQVRQRAGVSNWTAADMTEDNILDERMRELMFENWRKFDLIRTGRYAELMLARNKWTAKEGLMNNNHLLWPIPHTEIEQNQDMSADDQNPGYK